MPPARHAAALATLAVAACAGDPPAPPAEWRVLVKVVQPTNDGEAIARRASQVGGVPIRYVAATDARWHALLLHCADTAECEAALARLRADTRTFAGVERDERRRPHASP